MRVCFVYPFDAGGTQVGGIPTFIKGFWRYAPDDFEIFHIGIACGRNRSLHTWEDVTLDGRRLRVMSLLHVDDENEKLLLPLTLRFTFALSRVLACIPTDSILVFNRYEPALVCRRLKNPKIGFVHNDILKQLSKGSDSFWRFCPALYFALERAVVGELHKVYSVNKRTLALYRKKYPFARQQISFLPTWVDGAVFDACRDQSTRHARRRELSRKYRIDGAADYWVIFVGRLQHQKDPDLLVRSFSELCGYSVDAKLLIVGEGNLENQAKRVAEETGCKARVYFLGYLRQEELASLLSVCDALLLTSRYEGMPRSVLEALGCGIPVVTTRAGEVTLVVETGFNGEIVDDRSAGSIAAALKRVLVNGAVDAPSACLASVGRFRPKQVLAGVYEQCRGLNRSRRPSNE